MGWEGDALWGWLWLWGFFVPPSPVPPRSVWSPDPASVNSQCFSAGPRSGAGESCVSSACSLGNGTETEKEAPAAKGGLGTA